MEVETLENPIGSDELQIRSTVEKYLGALTCYLALNDELYPRSCIDACKILQQVVEKDTSIELKFCKGEAINQGKRCGSHAWLEYQNLIIDPTDYQFHVKDRMPIAKEDIMGDLIQDLIKDGYDINPPEGTYSLEEIREALGQAYLKRNEKRYRENPNEKEKYFIELTSLLKSQRLNPALFLDELKRCYSHKLFYSKDDPAIDYQQKDT
jgi:hypothetical protein